MFIGFIVGALGGLAAHKWMRYRSHFGGGCGQRGRGCHGQGGPGGHGRWGRHGGFGPWGFWRAVRYLDLSPRQRTAVQEVFTDVRETMWQARHGMRAELEPLVEALSADSFDRARVEEVAGRQTASFEKVKKQMIDTAERLHSILIPEQRAKLREILAQWSGGFSSAGDAGPYRTV